MKPLYLTSVIVLCFLYAFKKPASRTEQEEMAEKSILIWADNTFEFYDGARFENFHEVPSQEQFIIENKILVLQDFMSEQDQMFKAGEIKKSQGDFDLMQKKTTRKIDSLQNMLNHLDPNAKNYEVSFWANILVSNAVTVYYQHLVKLDSRFNVMSTKITGKVGTQPDGVKILYKKSATSKLK